MPADRRPRPPVGFDGTAVPAYTVDDYEREAYTQGERAVEAMDLDLDATFRWPWPSLDALTGPIAPGELWFLAALSGMGKTAFLLSLVDLLLAAGKRVHYLGLETVPERLRVHLACRRLARTVHGFDAHPADALNGMLKAREQAGDQHAAWCRRLLAAEFARQVAPDAAEHIRFHPGGALSVPNLYRATQDAIHAMADVIVVDHIDHHDSDGNPLAESRLLTRACLTSAQRSGIVHLVASQCNAAAMADGHLGMYAPPLPHHVWMGQTKRQVADGMLGLSKDLLPPPPPSADPKADKGARAEYQHLREMARHDSAALERLIVPGTMRVTLMKDRAYGRERASVALHVQQGRVVEPAPRDVWASQDVAPPSDGRPPLRLYPRTGT